MSSEGERRPQPKKTGKDLTICYMKALYVLDLSLRRM